MNIYAENENKISAKKRFNVTGSGKIKESTRLRAIY